MRDSITIITAVLGVLLVLAGGTVIVLRALASAPKMQESDAQKRLGLPDDLTAEISAVPPASSGPKAAGRVVRAVRQLPEADRLIGWGIILLVLAAISAGAISFSFSVQAGQ